MRYVVLAAVVVLVGGYVVGQQPASDSKPTKSAEEFITVDGSFERVPLKETDPIKIAAAAVAKTLAKPRPSEPGPVGRYRPFATICSSTRRTACSTAATEKSGS